MPITLPSSSLVGGRGMSGSLAKARAQISVRAPVESQRVPSKSKMTPSQFMVAVSFM